MAPTLLLAYALAAAAPLPAQDPAATYHYADQHAELNALFERISASAPADATLVINLSRMLSDPCDQLLWISEHLESPRIASPRALAVAAQARIDGPLRSWNPNLATQCGVYSSLTARLAELMAAEVWEITDDAASLVDAVKQEPLSDLTSDQKLMLLSRGVPTDRVSPDSNEDVPRRVIESLSTTAALPNMAALLKSARDLATARGRAQPSGALATTFDVAEGVLDRAMGFVDPASDYSADARSLTNQQLWLWAVLATTLDASAAAPADRAALVQGVEPLWRRFRAVNDALGDANAYAAIDDWQVRLTDPARLDVHGALPLTPDPAADAEARRAPFYAQIQSAADADALFQAIQAAKAAGIGRTDARPLTLQEFMDRLGQGANRIYLFIEAIEIPVGGTPQVYAVAVYAKLYNNVVEGANADSYVSRAIGPVAGLAEAIDSVWGDLPVTDEAKFVIAADGPLPKSWFAKEEQKLLTRVSETKRSAWLVYAPSALAWGDQDCWTLNETLRRWYPGVRAAGERLEIAVDPRTRAPRDLTSSLPRWNTLRLSSISLGRHPRIRQAQNFLMEVSTGKKSGATPSSVIPLLTAR